MSKFRLPLIFASSASGRVLDVVGRADQAGLLGAPEGEAHLLGRGDPELGHLDGRLEVRRDAGAVVVDARAGLDGVEVRADDDHVVRVAARRVGRHVGRRARLVRGVRGDVDRRGRRRPCSAPRRRRRRATRPGSPTGLPSVPMNASLRSGSAVLPWLKMITPTAPASSALAALTPKSHSPRWTRATSPAGKPVKSAGSQPDVTRLPTPRSRSTGVIRGVLHVARAGVVEACRSRSPRRTCARCPASVRAKVGRRVLRVEHEREELRLRVVARVLEDLDDVLDRVLVARQARRAVAAVRVADALEVLEVRGEAGPRDRLAQALGGVARVGRASAAW